MVGGSWINDAYCNQSSMKIGFYSPYLDTLGGGERYTLTLASHWSGHHSVSVFWDQADILDKAQKRFDINLSSIKVVQNIFRGSNVFKKLFITRQYDLLFFLSDGSIPSTIAKRNILHFQIPFSPIAYSRAKLSRYQTVVCNSQFTKRSLDARVAKHAMVIYPPVSPVQEGRGKKENLILSVGRFTGFHTAKKQNVLIEAFAQGVKDKKLDGWRLILAGGLLPSDRQYFDSLQSLAKGLPVTFEANISHSRLDDYYLKSKIYWHAAGYGETDPQWMEHFGIATVEAMSAGTVPVVYDGGGQPEIVKDGENGFLWRTTRELLEKTDGIITNENLAETLQKNAIKTSKQFSVSQFCQAFDRLLYEL